MKLRYNGTVLAQPWHLLQEKLLKHIANLSAAVVSEQIDAVVTHD